MIGSHRYGNNFFLSLQLPFYFLNPNVEDNIGAIPERTGQNKSAFLNGFLVILDIFKFFSLSLRRINLPTMIGHTKAVAPEK